MSSIGKGYIHIYTGNGKGKTTAALGLALRATGAGLKTIIVQFMKGQHYSELDAVKNLDNLVEIEQYGDKEFCRFSKNPDPKYIAQAHKGLKRLHEIFKENEWNIVVADESITAVSFNIISEQELLKIIKEKPTGMELVFTGRGATENLINEADLVTEMKEVKHYYREGVIARKGIEM
ncbi:MAG: cob(I)yrinic acid a,c-diamide adenosyltransferase [Elusimicrobiota bacterium]